MCLRRLRSVRKRGECNHARVDYNVCLRCTVYTVAYFFLNSYTCDATNVKHLSLRPIIATSRLLPVEARARGGVSHFGRTLPL